MLCRTTPSFSVCQLCHRRNHSLLVCRGDDVVSPSCRMVSPLGGITGYMPLGQVLQTVLRGLSDPTTGAEEAVIESAQRTTPPNVFPPLRLRDAPLARRRLTAAVVGGKWLVVRCCRVIHMSVEESVVSFLILPSVNAAVMTSSFSGGAAAGIFAPGPVHMVRLIFDRAQLKRLKEETISTAAAAMPGAQMQEGGGHRRLYIKADHQRPFVSSHAASPATFTSTCFKITASLEKPPPLSGCGAGRGRTRRSRAPEHE